MPIYPDPGTSNPAFPFGGNMLTTKPAKTSPFLVTYMVIAIVCVFGALIYIGFIANDDSSTITIETITVPIECVNNDIGCPVDFDRDIIAPEPSAGGYDSGAADGSNTPGASTCDSRYCTFVRTVRS